MGCEGCGTIISGLVVGIISIASFVFFLTGQVLLSLIGWIYVSLTRLVGYSNN